MSARVAVVACLSVMGAAVTDGASLSVLERQRLVSHLEMTAVWLADEVSRLTPAQLAFRRSPEEWSIAQVLDHLLVVAPIYWADLQAAMKGPPNTGVTRSTDADMLWYGIDRTNREKAIPTEVPKGQFRDVQSALAEYRKHHSRLLAYIRETKDDLRAHFVPRQGCDAYQWALLITTHEQRHILQIREIKADARFPR
jgi:hypothetical protein